jgi:transposase
MIIRKAYKYRLKAGPEQERLFRQQAGCCRFVWNKALALQKQRLDAGEKVLRYVEVAKLLTGWKREEKTAFLAEAGSQTLQQTLKFLDQAVKEAFDKKNPKRFPRFKKKGVSDSFRFPQGFKLDDDRVFLPKIGWARFRKSREIKGTPRNITVSRRGEHWYISIQTEMEVATPVHPSTSVVGIDLGIARFATICSIFLHLFLPSGFCNIGVYSWWRASRRRPPAFQGAGHFLPFFGKIESRPNADGAEHRVLGVVLAEDGKVIGGFLALDAGVRILLFDARNIVVCEFAFG